MIHFHCPNCRTVLHAPPDRAGSKFPCPGCGQRLQVPAAAVALDKTVVGHLLPAERLAVWQALAVPTAAPSLPCWYYVRGGQRFGPATREQLQQLAAARLLLPSDHVWRDGLPGWVAAGSVEGLFGQPAPAAGPGRPPAAVLAPLLAGAAALLLVGTATVLFVWGLGGKRPAAAATPVAAAAPAPPREPEAPKELSTEEIVAHNEKAVALIRHFRGSGTGFLVRPGILATNSHVLAGVPAERLQIYFPALGEAGHTPLPATLLYENRRRDLTFLRVPSRLAPVRVAEKYEFKRGQAITVIGNPGVGPMLTLENAVNQGVLSTQPRIEGQDYYQLSISINPGNSGGPVFDKFGEVIGVVTLKAAQQEGIAFCVPHKDLREAIAQAEAQKPGG
jgi:hypothetical protein